MKNLQAAFLTALGVSIGDNVKIVRDVPEGEQGNTYRSTAYSRRRVGGIYPIQEISGEGVQCEGFWYPATALEIIPYVEIDTGDGHTLRKDGNSFTETESDEGFAINSLNLRRLMEILNPIQEVTGYMPVIKIGCLELTLTDLENMDNA